ncbi:hypothetical protein G4F23_002970 [Salmonella enterica]|nr:hypothetical protein [Salmonella enterica]EEH8325684.1 hypothetical protein [Salmonella enterica]
MTSREQFETWANKLPSISITGYLERHGDQYVDDYHCSLWSAWQASRAMIEIELPEPFSLARSASGLTYYYQDEVDAQIELSGLKIKR